MILSWYICFQGNYTSIPPTNVIYLMNLLAFWTYLNLNAFLNQLPHMLPSDEAFAASVSALDIQNKDAVIVYDGKGQFSAARVWW